MPDLERLIRFVNQAPAGTMVPVDSLRELLAQDTPEATPGEERRLTPAEAAEWLHRHLGGRKRSAAAIRKVTRTGFRGVVLKSYPYGRERRTTESDLRHFVVEIGTVPLPATPEQIAFPVLPQPATTLAVETHLDPADEIAAAQERFRRRRTAPPSRPARQRRVIGGA
ncbi:MAG TPA: hypothetical protein VHG28_20865 [Longimicrobiaceae bacterium]|nr:hypothetical protein [Longimicrobiaceae bacterium]